MDISTDSRSYFGPNVVLGLGITALGLALLLDRLGVVDAWALLQFWPGLIVLFGASIVWQAMRGGAADAQRRERTIVSPGLVVLLVVIGVIASRSDLRNPNRTLTTGNDTVGVHAIMGESRQTSTAAHFRGANMTSIMGGSVLDLRQTKVAEGEDVVIEVFGLMGGLNLFVPRDWIVVSDVVPVMGKVDDRRLRDATATATASRRDTRNTRDTRDRADDWDSGQPARSAPPATAATASTSAASTPSANPPRLIIRGFIMMGGLEIRS